jgi:hypothetical protein
MRDLGYLVVMAALGAIAGMPIGFLWHGEESGVASLGLALWAGVAVLTVAWFAWLYATAD